MSLVIATNKDQDASGPNDQSIYSAWSFKNSLSSVYKIPANSEVCLQSCKVNLDGRLTITRSTAWWYDWFGEDLSLVDNTDVDDTIMGEAIDFTTSYPKLQDIQVPKGEILELTTDELAERINIKHREYHPNLKEQFTCTVQRNGGLDFIGFEFAYNQAVGQSYNYKPHVAKPFYDQDSVAGFTFAYSEAGGTSVFTRVVGSRPTPSVGICTDTPLSLSNGDMRVDISNCQNAGAGAGVEWGVGLSRDCPAPYLNDDESYTPYYFITYDGQDDESTEMATGIADYYEDFGVHRNEDGELILRHATNIDGNGTVFREVKYWLNSDSALTGAGRYDMATNVKAYTTLQMKAVGEGIEVYLIGGGKTDLITKYSSSQPKGSFFKAINQSCWCLHPVLYVGGDANNTLTITKYSGMTYTGGYDSRTLNKCGWFEQASILSAVGDDKTAACESVDERLIFDPTKTSDPYDYVPVGLGGTFAINQVYSMILTPNPDYFPTWGASTADLFGFPGRSLVNDGTGTFPATTFKSDEAPSLNSMLSVFVRLNGFGQQVMNARTGNQSTILSHLPTADSRATDGSAQRIFYEPKNLIWLDLKNPYELQVSEFNIDFVYSNEQYAKILQGQSIVCLYFRPVKASNNLL